MTSKPKILVVDDDQPILTLMRNVLREFQFDALTAASGEEALEIARKDNPDLVLLDINMPGMTGEETIAAFRADAALRATPIVIVSGYSVPQHEIQRLGADAAIQKPFDVPDLIRDIRERLNSRTP